MITEKDAEARVAEWMSQRGHRGVPMFLEKVEANLADADMIFVFAYVSRGGRSVDSWYVVELAIFPEAEVISIVSENVEGGERDYITLPDDFGS